MKDQELDDLKKEFDSLTLAMRAYHKIILEATAELQQLRTENEKLRVTIIELKFKNLKK